MDSNSVWNIINYNFMKNHEISVFIENEEIELQRLVRKIKYNQPTIHDMKRADELTRKKWRHELKTKRDET